MKPKSLALVSLVAVLSQWTWTLLSRTWNKPGAVHQSPSALWFSPGKQSLSTCLWGSAPLRTSTSWSCCQAGLQTWIFPILKMRYEQFRAVGKATEMFELLFGVLCFGEPKYTPSILHFVHCHLFTLDSLQDSLWQFTWAEEWLLSAILSSYWVPQCFLYNLRTKK